MVGEHPSKRQVALGGVLVAVVLVLSLLIQLSGSGGKWSELWYDVTVAVVGFGLTLTGAYLIFLVQRWYTKADRNAQAEQDEQGRLTLELGRELDAFKNNPLFRIPLLPLAVVAPILLEESARGFVSQLENYRVRLRDEELKRFCYLYSEAVKEVSKPFMKAPYVFNGFFGSVKLYLLATDASHALSHYLSEGLRPDASVFDDVVALRLRHLWKMRNPPNPPSGRPGDSQGGAG